MKKLILLALLVLSAKAQDCQQSYELSTSGSSSPIIDNRNRGCQLWNLAYWVEGFSALTVRLEYSIDQQTWTATTLSKTDTPVGLGNVRLYAPYFRVNLTSATGSGKVKFIVGGYKGSYGLTDIIAGGSGGGGGDLNAVDIDTSAELAAILTDETGTAGGFLRATTSSTVGQVLRVGTGPLIAFGALDLADADAITGLLPDANVAATLARDSEVAAGYQPLDADLTTLAGKTLVGTGANLRFSTGTVATDDCVKFDANGNLVSAGAACGSGSGTIAMPSISGGGTSTITVGSNCTTSNPCVFGKGEQTYQQTVALTCQITAGTSTDTVYVYVTKAGVHECGSNSRTITCGGVGGCQVPTSITAFPYDSIPMYAVTASGTAYDAITGAMDRRAILNTGRRLIDGTGIAFAEAAGEVTPSITSIVARRDVANSFTDKQTLNGNGASAAALNLASQTAPSSPANGDVWYSSNALNAQVNSSTIDVGAADTRLFHVKYWGTGSSFVLQDTDDELTALRNRYAGNATIVSVVCETDTGTPTVQLQKDDGSVTNMLSGSLTCDGTPTTSFVSGENVLATGDRLDVHIVSAGGSAHWVAITAVLKVKVN